MNDVINSNPSKLIRYYSGSTKDEEYDDETGNAFLVDFDEDGGVLLLYQGQFKSGLP